MFAPSRLKNKDTMHPLAEIEFFESADWYLKIRWVLVIISHLALYALAIIGGFNFPLNYVLAIFAFIALYNLLFTLHKWYLESKKSSKVDFRKTSHLQIALDLVSMTLLVHFTGGLESPFWFFFIFPTAASVMLLSPRATFVYALTAIFLYTSVVVLESYDLLHHFHLAKFFPPDLYFETGYVLSAIAVFATALVFSGYFSFSISHGLKEREERVSLLLEISRILRSTLGLEAIVQKVEEEIPALLRAEHGTFFLLNDDKMLETPNKGTVSNRNEKSSSGSGLESAYQAVKTGKIVSAYFSSDAEKEALGSKIHRPKILISLPLKARNKTVGALNLVFGRGLKFRKKERDFLSSVADRVALSADNSILFDAIERKVSELSVLYEVGKTTTSSLNLKKILQLSLDSVLNLLDAGSGSIMLFDKKGEELTTVAARGHEKNDPQKTEAIKKGKRILNETENVLCVPLMVKDKAIGAFNVGNKRAGLFNQDDLNLLSSLGSGIAMAIENASMYEDRKKEVKQVALINEASRVISSSLNIDQIYSVLVSELGKLVAFDRVSISLLDKTGDHVEVFAVTNKGEILERRTAKPKDVCCADWVTEHKRPLLRPDVKTQPHFLDDQIVAQEGIRTCFSLPLMVKDKVLGTFCLYNKRTAAYTDEDLVVLQPIAEQLAIAIENAKLYEDLRESLFSTVEALAKAVDAKDSFTAGHANRVTKYALALAQDFGFSPAKQKGIEIAAKLHDIGKIGISEKLLLKKDKLTKKERETLKKHPLIGASIIMPLNFSDDILKWIKYHHEQPDGHGYPDALPSGKLPLGASILKVADAFEAMTSDRPYRKALSTQEALFELQKYSGSQFDTQVVESFSRLLNESPLLTASQKIHH